MGYATVSTWTTTEWNDELEAAFHDAVKAFKAAQA